MKQVLSCLLCSKLHQHALFHFVQVLRAHRSMQWVNHAFQILVPACSHHGCLDGSRLLCLIMLVVNIDDQAVLM